jgi:uncharacterized DUF497 family protein
MRYEFRWNDWNIGHIAEHGILPEEAEAIVQNARPPFPREIGRGKAIVRGQLSSGDYLQVIFVVDPDDTLYVVHARPLAESEKRKIRRGRS